MFEQQIAWEKKQKTAYVIEVRVSNKIKKWMWKRVREKAYTVLKMEVISYLTRQRPVRTAVQGYCTHRHIYIV